MLCYKVFIIEIVELLPNINSKVTDILPYYTTPMRHTKIC